MLGVEQIVVAEAMLLGQSLGLDPAVLASVINSSTGGCWASSVNNPVPSALPDKSPPCERDYEGGFATTLMLKVDAFRQMHVKFLLTTISGYGTCQRYCGATEEPYAHGRSSERNIFQDCGRTP